MSEEQKRLLEAKLWNIANELRGKMDADDFRDYILGFIFYKYLSEKFSLFANNLLKSENIRYEDLEEETLEGDKYIDVIKYESLEKLGYFLRPSELFSKLTAKGTKKFLDTNESNFILGDLTLILNHIEQSTLGTDSEEDFNKLFEDLDLTSTKLGKTEKQKNEVIVKIMNLLQGIDFKLEDADSDILGDAYEFLIAQFASGAGKKAGEFYTPQGVSKVLAKIVSLGKNQLRSVYDPTCGSGSLLLRIAKETKVGNFYGQERNRTTYNLTRMNMILHNIPYQRFDIKHEDTLLNPQHMGLRFEAVVANPPFSAKWEAKESLLNDERFNPYGKLAPSSKADFAFVQHMIYHLSDSGTMAVVLPHGVLFRGGSEEHIRKYLIENCNYLDAVIGLPANIFYGTSIPTCIMVFKKCRKQDDNIVFIDASKNFDKLRNQNFLNDDNINNIIEAYKNRKNIDKYCYVATLEEIKNNNHNLNIPRYVNTYEEEELLDIDKISQEIQKLTDQSKTIDLEIKKFCDILNISSPF